MRTFVRFACGASAASPALVSQRVGARAIVRPAVGFLLVTDTAFTQGSRVSAQAIRHDLLGATVPLQRFLQEFQRGPSCRDAASRNAREPALVTDGPPKVVLLG